MAHNIFAQRIELREKPGWHNLGNVFPKDEKLSLVDATKRVVDYEVLSVPVYAEIGGEFILIKDRSALVRTPTIDDPIYRPFEVVSQTYKLVDNFILADIFNAASLEWPVETIGVLNHGQTLFATLDAGMFEIKGDLIHQFFLLSDSKDRRSATLAAYTPMRVVCKNTLTIGFAQATLKMSISHSGQNQTYLRKIAVSIQQMQGMMDNTNALFDGLARTPYSLNEFKAILAQSIYPDPILPDDAVDVTGEFDRLMSKQLDHRLAAEDLFVKFNDEHPNIGGTKWAAYNAVVELEDWKPGRGQAQFTSSVFGQRAQKKQNAFAVLSK